MGVVFAGHGKPADARVCYEIALRTAPNFIDARRNLGLLLHSEGKYEEAVSQFREVLKLNPEDATAKHLVAALTGEAAPEHSSPDYVASLFDGYAGHFDDHLVKVLKYRGPEMLREALAEPDKSKALDVLDLGCGTGLCGTVLRERARKLVGVDLSAKMLAKARERGIYDELIQGDVMIPLEAAQSAFDLIVAWDVFAYIGDLAPVFQAAKKALRGGGRLMFWVESNSGHDHKDFALRESGRFAHSGAYLSRIAQSAGFEEVSLSTTVARTDREKGIESLVVVLRAAT